MNMQLMAQSASVVGPMPFAIIAAMIVWLISMIVVVSLIVFLVKHALGCKNGRPNLPLIIILVIVALVYFKHHSSFPTASSWQSAQAQTVQAGSDAQSRGEQLEIAIKNYTDNVLNAQIDKLTQMAMSYGGTSATEVQSTLCATTADADQEARNAAEEILLPHVKAAMEPRIAGSAMLRSIVKEDWIKTQIKSSVARGVNITHRHVDRVDRPYGTLWKETLGVDTSSAAIESNFVAPYLQLAQAQAQGRRNEWASLAGLAGVMILLYSFLNSATKGYFVWRLRAVATLVLIAAVLAIFALA